MKNSIDFHVFIVSFYYFSLGNNTSCTVGTVIVRVRPLLSTFPSAPMCFYLTMVNMCDQKQLILHDK